jgi:hypothetical protein
MHERLKIFSFLSGHGETIVQPPHESHINEWLSRTQGKLLSVSQSESEHAGTGHHVTVCIWYLPVKDEQQAQVDQKTVHFTKGS